MSRIKTIFSGGGRFIFILLLMAVIYSYAMFQGGFVSWFVFFTIMPFLIYSFLLLLFPIKIEQVEREVKPSKLMRGDTAHITVKFRNKTWFPIIFLTIQEAGMGNEFFEKTKGRSSNIFFVGWRRRFEWTYELENLQRGQIEFEGLQFTFSDFFGWTVRHKFIEEKKVITVFPKIIPIKYKALQMPFDYGGANSPYSLSRDSTMVTGVRDYQSGDRSSWIHWKSFAKNETLRTKEFEDRKSEEVFLCIDRSSQNNFELTVDFAASILQSVVNNRGNISFLSAGDARNFFPNIKSQSQLEKVMRHLAVVKADATQGIDVVLSYEAADLSSAIFILVTSELSDELRKFFVQSSKFSRGLVCFVLTEKPEILREKRINISNVKVIPITEKMFEHAFTEVMKP